MKKFSTCLIFLLSMFLLQPNASPAEDSLPVTVDVEGYAVVEGGKKAAARDGALNDAFRRAVEQVVGVMIESKTVVKNSELIQDKIFSKSAGFIKTYKITSERFEPDSCRLGIRATVSRVRLEKSLNDVGLLSRKLGKPRVAIIMTEQNIGNDAPVGSLAAGAVNAGVADSVLHGTFAKKGYNLVDRDVLVSIARRDGMLAASGQLTSSEAAAQVAAGGGAEVVIIGQAVAKAGAAPLSGSNLRASQATVSARVVDADTAQLLASYSATSQAVHVNPTAGGSEAIRKAAQDLAENLNKQIVAKWSRKVSGTRSVKLTIKGVDFGDIARIRELCRERIGHLEETIERGFRDRTLHLDAEVSGNARELADELAAADLEGYSFKVMSFTGNTVNLQLHKK